MHAWQRELWVFAACVGLGALAGAIGDNFLLGLAVGSFVYIGLLLRHVRALYVWLLNKKRDDIPDAAGIWGEIFDEIRKLERLANKREERLTSALARFQRASAAIPDAMVVLTSQDEIEWANPAAAYLLGLRWPRDHGQRVINLVRDPVFTDYLQAGDFQTELRMRSPAMPDNRIAVQLIAFGEAEKLLIGRDITHLSRLEEMRSQFVANVSHELRTPVTVLLGFLETLRGMDDYSAKELKQHLGTMYEQAVRMQRLVDDLLTLSKLETSPAHVREEDVDMRGLMQELCELAKLLSGAQAHRIDAEVQGPPVLRGNREELRSAFTNLVNNAVRYTPPGGAIHLSWRSDAEGGRFAVRDSGEGIAAQHIPRLTERFYRVDSGRSRASGGTGLGLSIVKHVLTRHEGRLAIESAPGQGSTFTCVFPAERLRA